MATGSSKYSDISSLVPSIYEGALFTLKNTNRLLPAVYQYSGTGNAPRVVPQYSSANPREVIEGEDITPTQLTKTSLATFTPKIVRDSYLITDIRMETDPDDVMRDASIELGESFADKVDTDIVGTFASLTGGTVGSAGQPLTWTMISNAQAILSAQKARGMLWCVLHPYQWADLVATATSAGHSIASVQNGFNDLSGVYFQSASLANATFIVTNAMTIDGSDDVTGAMFASQAIGFDTRKGFNIETQREASLKATNLVAEMIYAVGVLRPLLGVKIISDATTPA